MWMMAVWRDSWVVEYVLVFEEPGQALEARQVCRSLRRQVYQVLSAGTEVDCQSSCLCDEEE